MPRARGCGWRRGDRRLVAGRPAPGAGHSDPANSRPTCALGTPWPGLGQGECCRPPVPASLGAWRSPARPSGQGLNRARIERSVLSGSRLNRRRPNREPLRREENAGDADRNQRYAPISSPFPTAAEPIQLKRLDPTLESFQGTRAKAVGNSYSLHPRQVRLSSTLSPASGPVARVMRLAFAPLRQSAERFPNTRDQSPPDALSVSDGWKSEATWRPVDRTGPEPCEASCSNRDRCSRPTCQPSNVLPLRPDLTPHVPLGSRPRDRRFVWSGRF